MNELKEIKKIYGEEMMHLCRASFSTILENKGLLLRILKENLAPTRSFVSDIKDGFIGYFINWIYSFVEYKNKILIDTNKTPFELMDEAGYILYECTNEEDIQKFRIFYEDNEVLCTLKQGNRLDKCHVFFAVKKDVQNIKRSSNPERQDEYGTSVISLQFTKGKNNFISIKNRYNDHVIGSDATFSNDLENIIPGLTRSFEKYYGFNICHQDYDASDFLSTELRYVNGIGGTYYRCNLEDDNIQYCENNIIIDDGVLIDEYAKNPERYIVMDQYILDLKEKTISLYKKEDDSFIKSINDVGLINKIMVVRDKDEKIIIINYEDNINVKIRINKNNAIVEYENEYVEEIGNDFLPINRMIRNIFLPNVRKIGHKFLQHCINLRELFLPEVEYIGDFFLEFCFHLKNIYLPKVLVIGRDFLYHNRELNIMFAPDVQVLGDNYLNDHDDKQSIGFSRKRKL